MFSMDLNLKTCVAFLRKIELLNITRDFLSFWPLLNVCVYLYYSNEIKSTAMLINIRNTSVDNYYAFLTCYVLKPRLHKRMLSIDIW